MSQCKLSKTTKTSWCKQSTFKVTAAADCGIKVHSTHDSTKREPRERERQRVGKLKAKKKFSTFSPSCPQSLRLIYRKIWIYSDESEYSNSRDETLVCVCAHMCINGIIWNRSQEHYGFFLFLFHKLSNMSVCVCVVASSVLTLSSWGRMSRVQWNCVTMLNVKHEVRLFNHSTENRMEKRRKKTEPRKLSIFPGIICKNRIYISIRNVWILKDIM